MLGHAAEVGAAEVEVSEEAEQAWVAMLESNAQPMLSNPDCTPGYYNNEGREGGRRELLNGAGYPQGPVAFFEFIDGWRESGKFEGLEFRQAT